MKELRRAVIGLLLTSWCILGLGLPTMKAETLQHNKELMQKGLTIYEIDQELLRIMEQEAQLQSQLVTAEEQLHTANRSTAEARTHAAQVIRAYYMGDRDSLWNLLFSIRSFSEALASLDYLQMILRNDQQALKRHTDAWRQLNQVKAGLIEAQTGLQQTKSLYLAQRARLVSLQQEVDDTLAENKETAVQLQQQMLELNRLWHDKGVPMLRIYFQALGEALKQLPEIVTAGSGSGGNLIMNGFNYTFQVTDQELNDFLRQKNEIFTDMTFRFSPDKMTASGERDGISLLMVGSYEMTSQGEDQSMAYLRFRITELRFNGFTLPSTTIEALEKDFDLGLYPQNIAAFLRVTGVTIEDGKLSVMLKLAL
ncbi:MULTISPECIES: hypothetical protein [unclassified Paenibacillus]|uniref:hypothetical protein n=1 Tax=unclassified Paenibacillus TaxID=185978 RepID=UPI001AE29BC6|nr:MULTISPECIES: hypothetical protein [unclassified Paenibacillus]MBP1156297.1 hypothetical protein [Paenibacillus sp. PvP091]MBP1168317.1 hypothetical protein [Paenibacillus sp. PvR098]MBP2439345.1 hypothetical protein [Paenibacillus sp. PvP052]